MYLSHEYTDPSSLTLAIVLVLVLGPARSLSLALVLATHLRKNNDQPPSILLSLNTLRYNSLFRYEISPRSLPP
jgi:hypothetical protein